MPPIMSINFQESERLKNLPIYVFARLDELKAQAVARGDDLIDLGMGNPDLPVRAAVIKKAQEALNTQKYLKYPAFDGLPEFREAAAKWVERTGGGKVDPKTEVIPLIGSKEGLVHFSFAFINPGDITLMVKPAYPAHIRGTLLAGGTPVAMPLKNGSYLPDFSKIDIDLAKKAKMMILSYPSNPTAQVAPRSLFEEAVAFCKKYNIILVHDYVYGEIYYEGEPPVSLMSIPGAKDIGIEFRTMSKVFSMAGFRVGYATGNKQLLRSLIKLKTNLDYGLFMVNQLAAIEAFNISDAELVDIRKIYQKRRDIFVDGINALGWKVAKPTATFYVWLPIPEDFDTESFTMFLLDKAGIAVTPGTAFGEEGEGYVRVSMVQSEERIKEALERMKKIGISFPKSKTKVSVS
jgi:LL-diaminopimelate aminotransferase